MDYLLLDKRTCLEDAICLLICEQPCSSLVFFLDIVVLNFLLGRNNDMLELTHDISVAICCYEKVRGWSAWLDVYCCSFCL